MDCRKGDGGGGNQVICLGNDDLRRDRRMLRQTGCQSELVKIKLGFVKPLPISYRGLRYTSTLLVSNKTFPWSKLCRSRVHRPLGGIELEDVTF